MEPFVRTIHARGVLSFAPDSEPLPLTALNVLIGPNGSGKSNLIEIFELLKAAPVDLAAAFRVGGGIGEWLWKGGEKGLGAAIRTELLIPQVTQHILRYRLEFGSTGQRMEILDESVDEQAIDEEVFTYYSFNRGHPVIVTQGEDRELGKNSFDPRQSVLSQRRDPDLYPDVTAIGRCFGHILTLREWSFGRYGPLRQPQPADLPDDMVLQDAHNLGLILNAIDHDDVLRPVSMAPSAAFCRVSDVTPRQCGAELFRFFCTKTVSALRFQPRDCPTERSGSSHYWQSC